MTSRAAILLLCASVLGGCDRPDLFRVSGYQQESFSNDADVLFVIDNSGSMDDESYALGQNFGTFIDTLAGDEGDAGSNGLVDAVDNYIEFASRRTGFIDYAIGVTSTDVESDYGGLFGDPKVLEFGTPDITEAFRETTLCEATYLTDAAVPSDPGYTCGDPVDEVSQEYLDCLCGADAWRNNGGSGSEMGLEAVFMAMCRAVPEPPEACYYWNVENEEENQFTDADVMSNEGLLREGSTFIPVIVSDEGDVSTRMSQGDGIPTVYDDLFRQFDHRMAWAVIGPEPGVCDGGTTVPGWAAGRYEWFVDDTNGLWVPITTGEPDCEVTDFNDALQQLGELINRLNETFPLQAVPDPETLLVFVDGDKVPRATVEEVDGATVHRHGWSYDLDDNAVSFHDDWIPDYNAKVRIYYLPISGQPRDLPF